jgi:hypothetical protein
MSREAMKQALDMLNEIADDVYCDQKLEGVIAALRQALETEQEPVAFINVEKQKLEWAKLTSWHTPTIVNLPKIPLYTAPPKKEWVGLTDEEYKIIHYKNYNYIELARAVEAKLKEKNI